MSSSFLFVYFLQESTGHSQISLTSSSYIYMSYILHEVVCYILHVFFLLFGVLILHLLHIVCIRGDL